MKKNKRLPSLQILIVIIMMTVPLILILLFFYTNNTVDSRMVKVFKNAETIEDKRLLADEVHKIGHEIGSEKNKTLKELLQKCGDPNFIRGACLHGVVMGMNHREEINKLAEECLSLTNLPIIYTRNCVHAVGHTFYDAKDIVMSLDRCNKSIGIDYVKDCESGVFMEYMLGTHSMAKGLEITDIKFPECNKMPENYKLSCSGSIGGYTLYYLSSSLEKTINLCKNMDASIYVKYCLLSAVDMLGSAPVTELKSFCSLLAKTSEEYLTEIGCKD